MNLIMPVVLIQCYLACRLDPFVFMLLFLLPFFLFFALLFPGTLIGSSILIPDLA